MQRTGGKTFVWSLEAEKTRNLTTNLLFGPPLFSLDHRCPALLQEFSPRVNKALALASPFFVKAQRCTLRLQVGLFCVGSLELINPLPHPRCHETRDPHERTKANATTRAQKARSRHGVQSIHLRVRTREQEGTKRVLCPVQFHRRFAAFASPVRPPRKGCIRLRMYHVSQL